MPEHGARLSYWLLYETPLWQFWRPETRRLATIASHPASLLFEVMSATRPMLLLLLAVRVPLTVLFVLVSERERGAGFMLQCLTGDSQLMPGLSLGFTGTTGA